MFIRIYSAYDFERKVGSMKKYLDFGHPISIFSETPDGEEVTRHTARTLYLRLKTAKPLLRAYRAAERS